MIGYFECGRSHVDRPIEQLMRGDQARFAIIKNPVKGFE